MNALILNCLSIFLLSALTGGILIPQILLIAFRRNLFDTPDRRKIHHSLVPRLGGIAFTPVVFLSIAFMLGVDCITNHWTLYASMNGSMVEISLAICSILILYLVGMADDLVGVRYSAKFAVQIICAALMLIGGMGVTDYEGLLLLHNVSPWVGWPLTVFFIVFVLNAVNLIDGIDGLASGLSAIAFILYGIFFIFQQSYFYAMLSFATLGVLVPFYYYNVFGKAEKQKKIFMGDTGSLTIGFLIVYLGLRILTLPQSDIFPLADSMGNRMIIVLSPLMVPCFDVVRVYFHRVRNHVNPFLPDKNHIHHKLLAIGVPQRRAMLAIVGLSLLFCIANIMVSDYVNINILILIDIIIWTGWNMTLRSRINKMQK